MLKSSLAKPDFLSSGVTKAAFKEVGNDPSERHMFTSLVIGSPSASIQDFNSGVGSGSRRQDESVPEIIIPAISSTVAGTNSDNTGGGDRGTDNGSSPTSGSLAHNVDILSLKNCYCIDINIFAKVTNIKTGFWTKF